MIVKAKARGGVVQLGHYMMSKGENESVRVIAFFGLHEQEDPYKAIKEMGRSDEVSGSKEGFYHGQLSPDYEESMKLDDAAYLDMVMITAKHLEYDNPRGFMTEHIKNGHKHIHFAFDRYDYAKGKLVSDSYNYYKHDKARKEIEEKYDLVRTPRRNPRKQQYQDAALSTWRDTTSGQAFVDALKEQGLYVAVSKQESRPFRLMDEAGRSSNLVRDMRGVRTAEVRERLKDVKLPMDTEVREQLKNQKRQESKKSEHKETAEQVTMSGRDKFIEQQRIDKERRRNRGMSR